MLAPLRIETSLGMPDIAKDFPDMRVSRIELRRGIHEFSGLHHNNPEVLKYFLATTLAGSPAAKLDETFWCAAYEAWIEKTSGLQCVRSASAASYASYGHASSKSGVRYGDLIVRVRQGGHHVHRYVGAGRNGYYALGGNQANSVCIELFPWAGVIAVRTPDRSHISHGLLSEPEMSLAPVILQNGDHGPQIVALQEKLKELGYYTDNCDGYFATNTINAVMKAQHAFGLTVDGVVGPETAAHLSQAVAPEEPLPAGKDPGTPLAVLPSYKTLVKGTIPWYRAAFQQMALTAGYTGAVTDDCKIVLHGKTEYLAVQTALGIPWYVVGAIHMKEASCNMKACLANGDEIIGTGRKTTHVPKGRGPYATFHASAIDALKSEAIGENKNWEIGNLLRLCELYNGAGYLPGYPGNVDNSPYIWARTTINDGRGKYVADGVWNRNATTLLSSGVAAMLFELEKMGEIKLIRA